MNYLETKLYTELAKAFAEKVYNVFENEDTMEAYYVTMLSGAPFDRTFFWDAVIPLMFEEIWMMNGPIGASKSTMYDKKKMAGFLPRYLDYSLFTQILLNLYPQQIYSYDSLLASQLRNRLEEKYTGKVISPFVEKAKMIKLASKPEEIEYNTDLSALKAASVIEKLGVSASYRVSPMGTTPAFADSNNLSMLGQGADQFLRVAPGFRVAYLSWATPGRMTQPYPDGSFKVEGIDYPFRSKSGGSMLNETLFSRRMAVEVWIPEVEMTVFPRINSVMVVAQDLSFTKEVVEIWKKSHCPSLIYTENTRPTI